MKHTWTTYLLTPLAVAGLAFPAVAEEVEPADTLQQMARAADSAADHAAVAREYRLRGETLAAKAKEYEREVARLTRTAPAMYHKWPSMGSTKLNKAKKNAVQARRASREAFELADRHIALAVESQAGDRLASGHAPAPTADPSAGN